MEGGNLPRLKLGHGSVRHHHERRWMPCPDHERFVAPTKIDFAEEELLRLGLVRSGTGRCELRQPW